MPFPFPPSFPHKIWKSVRFKSFRLLPSFSQPPPSLPPTPGIIWSPVSVVTSMSPLLSEYLHGGSLFPVLALCPSSPTSESPGYFDSNSSLRPSSVVWNLQRLNNSFWLSPIYPSCNMPQNDLAFYCHPIPSSVFPMSSLPPEKNKALTLYFCSCCCQCLSTHVQNSGAIFNFSAPLEGAVHVAVIGHSAGSDRGSGKTGRTDQKVNNRVHLGFNSTTMSKLEGS